MTESALDITGLFILLAGFVIGLGITLAIVGGLVLYRQEALSGVPLAHSLIALILVANGCFLSCKVSPFMLRREKEGRSGELLPASWQRRIMASLVISDIGWWGGLFLLATYLINR
ncbi:MAG: hypothetical protein WC375_02715 [Methanomassiliicoccales archaeon]|jgi:hypothetical protein